MSAFDTKSETANRRAIIIGGSLGGLFAGTMLRKAGWEVDIFERSTHDMEKRGGGIVLQPDVVEVFRRGDVPLDPKALEVGSENRVAFRPDGTVQAKQWAPQAQTSWSLVFSALKSHFGEAHYHKGKHLIEIAQDDRSGTATARFADGTEATGDLLVGADGNGSTVRGLLWPGEDPTYAGYLAWRGLVPEDDMPPLAREALHGDFASANNKGSHILGYLIPGEDGEREAGKRLYNYVWYRVADAETLADIMTDREGRVRGFSIPEGQLTDKWTAEVRADAERLLPPGFKEIVQATELPFAQAIRDFSVSKMVKGRVVLLGDAAFIPRPHTAASTSKAAANALALGEALSQSPNDIDAALRNWEPDQMRLGRYLAGHGQRIGDHLMFHSEKLGQTG